ncbi:hypothetical protein HK405_000705, partial [Cladochytrium tenue]
MDRAATVSERTRDDVGGNNTTPAWADDPGSLQALVGGNNGGNVGGGSGSSMADYVRLFGRLQSTSSSLSLEFEASAVALAESAGRTAAAPVRAPLLASVSETWEVDEEGWGEGDVGGGVGDGAGQVVADGLDDSVVEDYSQTGTARTSSTSLPGRTMAVLSVVVLCEPISMTVLFPFVYFMVRDFGIAENDVGYYVGFLTGAFSLAQFVTSIPWGWISDRIGRRPVLMVGLLGNTVSMVLFGMSSTLWAAIASRALCGLLNGNVGVAKSMLGEITDASNQASAFSIFGLMWALGLIVGPGIGGLLASPVQNIPGLFAGFPILTERPYLLPCLFSALLSAVGFVAALAFLDESLGSGPGGSPKRQGYVPVAQEVVVSSAPLEEEGDGDNNDDSNPEHPLMVENGGGGDGSGVNEMVMPPTAFSTISAYALLAFREIIFDEIFSLWAVAPPKIGGLGFSASDIGLCLSIIGCATLFLQLVVYPRLARRYSALRLFRVGQTIYAVVFVAFPPLAALADVPDQGRELLWAALLAALVVRQVAEVMSYTSVMILIKDAADGGNLGIVNGSAQTLAALARSVGPLVGGSAWAFGLTSGLGFPLDTNLVFALLVTLGVAGAVHARWRL